VIICQPRYKWGGDSLIVFENSRISDFQGLGGVDLKWWWEWI